MAMITFVRACVGSAKSTIYVALLCVSESLCWPMFMARSQPNQVANILHLHFLSPGRRWDQIISMRGSSITCSTPRPNEGMLVDTMPMAKAVAKRTLKLTSKWPCRPSTPDIYTDMYDISTISSPSQS